MAPMGASAPPAAGLENPLAAPAAGGFMPSGELGQGGGIEGIQALLQGLAQMMGQQQPMDPIQQLQQEIQKTEMQLQQAQILDYALSLQIPTYSSDPW